MKKDSVTKLVPIVSSARAVRIICEKWKNNYNYLLTVDAAIDNNTLKKCKSVIITDLHFL